MSASIGNALIFRSLAHRSLHLLGLPVVGCKALMLNPMRVLFQLVPGGPSLCKVIAVLNHKVALLPFQDLSFTRSDDRNVD